MFEKGSRVRQAVGGLLFAGIFWVIYVSSSNPDKHLTFFTGAIITIVLLLIGSKIAMEARHHGI